MESGIVHILPSGMGDLWFVEIAISLFVLIGVNYIFKKIILHIRKRSLSTHRDWRDRLDYIFLLPVKIMLWTLGGIFVVEVMGRRFDFALFEGYLNPFRASLVICCLAWILLRWKNEFQTTVLEKSWHTKKIDATCVQLLGKILTLMVLLVVSMVVLQLWGLNIGPLIAFGGIGAAALGFAAKDMIGNFFGGLMLYITRPFMQGDWIVIPERQIEGQVEEIGWYVTSVRDKDKRPMYLPNALFSNAFVINGSRMTHRRIEHRIGIRYEDYSKVEAVLETMRQSIAAHPAIDTHLPIIVFLSALNQYTIDLSIDVYTLVTRYDEYLAVKQEILMLMYNGILAQGAEVPCPIVELKGSRQPV